MTLMQILRWFWDNKGSLLLAFILALTVWVAAVSADDPTEQRFMDEVITINYIPPREGLMVVGDLPQFARVEIRAPKSVWKDISTETIKITVDLSNLDEGNHRLDLEVLHDLRPLRVTSIEPASLSIALESVLSKQIPVLINVVGDPAIEFDAGQASFDPKAATISGPASSVDKVVEVRGEIEITGARQVVEEDVVLLAYDKDGLEVTQIQIDPNTVFVSVPIEQSDRYKLVSVIPNIVGSPAYGYRPKSIEAFPDLVQVTSSDPEAIAQLAGSVNTEAIDITDATETIERRVFLSLPAGFTIVGNQTILVKVTIEPIESTISFNLGVEIQGLDPTLAAELTPDSVIITLTGPLIILDQLQREDVHVVVNLLDFEEGSHVVTPEIIVAQVEVQAEIIPASIEVEITPAPPATATPLP
jgi:YbbR domain-containing protein